MDRNLRETQLRNLFQQQLLGVLATDGGTDGPYVSLIAFVACEDLSRLVFVTKRSTRKFRNLINTPQVSMLIDNRTNQANDFRAALAVTAIGSAVEQAGTAKAGLLELFLDKYPDLESFALEPSCALMAIQVSHYILVSNLQQVIQLDMPGIKGGLG